MTSGIENGMLLSCDESDAVIQEDYDFYWQDDIRKDTEIQVDLQELNNH